MICPFVLPSPTRFRFRFVAVVFIIAIVVVTFLPEPMAKTTVKHGVCPPGICRWSIYRFTGVVEGGAAVRRGGSLKRAKVTRL